MTRPNYMDLVRDTHISSIISPKDMVANQITRYVRALANSEGSFVESLYKMMGGQVEALEFTAGPECRQLLDRPMKDLPLKQGSWWEPLPGIRRCYPRRQHLHP